MTSSGAVVLNSGEPGRMDGVKKMDTILRLEEIKQKPLREFLATFDDDRNGKIDISELQLLAEYHRWWKWSAKLLFMLIMIIIASIFGLTNVAILLTKDMGVKNGHLAAQGAVVKMSVARLAIPLGYASLLDARHLDALESVTVVNTRQRGGLAAGTYKMGVAAYVHANETYVRFFGGDGAEILVRNGAAFVTHPKADGQFLVCASGGPTCNTLAVDVDNAGYLDQLRQRAATAFKYVAPAAEPSRRRLAAADTCFGKRLAFTDGTADEKAVAYRKWLMKFEGGRRKNFCRYGGDAANFQAFLAFICHDKQPDPVKETDRMTLARCVNFAMHGVYRDEGLSTGPDPAPTLLITTDWWQTAMGDANNWQAMGVVTAAAKVASGLTSLHPAVVSAYAMSVGGNSAASFWGPKSWANACNGVNFDRDVPLAYIPILTDAQASASSTCQSSL